MLTSQWIQGTHECLQNGQPVFPESVDQLVWLIDNFPEYAPRWLPPRDEMEHLGLACDFGRMRPFSDAWQEQVILTAVESPQFAAALRVVLTQGGVA